jgi:cyclic beta-1,2-glucan synthetase
MAFAQFGVGDRAAELLTLLNPIHHTRTAAGVHRYRLEPYAVAADIYSQPPHVGRGGWSWYTGSSGWMYRAAVEWLLGLRRHGAALSIAPCIPRAWPRFEARVRFGSTLYNVTVENPRGVTQGVTSLELDGHSREAWRSVPLQDDGGEHEIRAVLG